MCCNMLTFGGRLYVTVQLDVMYSNPKYDCEVSNGNILLFK